MKSCCSISILNSITSEKGKFGHEPDTIESYEQIHRRKDKNRSWVDAALEQVANYGRWKETSDALKVALWGCIQEDDCIIEIEKANKTNNVGNKCSGIEQALPG